MLWFCIDAAWNSPFYEAALRILFLYLQGFSLPIEPGEFEWGWLAGCCRRHRRAKKHTCLGRAGWVYYIIQARAVSFFALAAFLVLCDFWCKAWISNMLTDGFMPNGIYDFVVVFWQLSIISLEQEIISEPWNGQIPDHYFSPRSIALLEKYAIGKILIAQIITEIYIKNCWHSFVTHKCKNKNEQTCKNIIPFFTAPCSLSPCSIISQLQREINISG